MKENEGQPKQASTCFEGSTFAEMLQKIMGQQRIGSLSEEMMRSLIHPLDKDGQEPNPIQKGEESK